MGCYFDDKERMMMRAALCFIILVRSSYCDGDTADILRPSYSLIDRTLDSLFRDSAISNTTDDEVTIADVISGLPGEISGDNDTDDISNEVSVDKENRLNVNSSEINKVDAENESENASSGCRKASKRGIRMLPQENNNHFHAEFSLDDAEYESETAPNGCRKATKKGDRMPLQDITNQFLAEFSLLHAEN